MDQTADGAVIVTEKIENETELQLKAIIGSSSSSETVNGCCAEEINQRLKQLTGMVIETINKMVCFWLMGVGFNFFFFNNKHFI